MGTIIWPMKNLRKGVPPADLFNNGEWPKVTIRGKFTEKNIRTVTFFFGFPLLIRVGKDNYILWCENDVHIFWGMCGRDECITLTLERPKYASNMKLAK